MEYLVRLALIIGVAAALLTGCGGSQPPIGAPGPMPQAGRAHARPLTSSGALIYSANSYFGYVTTYTYPHGPRLGEIRAPGAIRECVDSAGDVFVAATTGTTGGYTGNVYELAQGSLIATLPDPHWWIGYCAVNPKTGDLTVSGNTSPGDEPGITIYRQAKGTPEVLYTSPYYVGSCAYDPAGNLYLSVSYGNSGQDTGLLRLPAGSKNFELMTSDITITYPGSVQWADGHLIVTSAHPGELYLYELSIKGNTATTVRTTILHTDKYRDHFLGQVWVQGNTVLAYLASGVYKKGHIGLSAYPRGGLLRDKINVDAYGADGLAVARGQ